MSDPKLRDAKLGSAADRAMIAAIQAVTAVPVRVDVNQACLGPSDTCVGDPVVAAVGGYDVQRVVRPLSSTAVDVARDDVARVRVDGFNGDTGTHVDTEASQAGVDLVVRAG